MINVAIWDEKFSTRVTQVIQAREVNRTSARNNKIIKSRVHSAGLPNPQVFQEHVRTILRSWTFHGNLPERERNANRALALMIVLFLRNFLIHGGEK